MPKVSVLMPVFNGEKYISQAIDSILDQSFGDFELIIVDDGSTDSSADIIASYSDERIRYYANRSNLGLAFARNRAIELSSGEYLAWLDSDDVSHPERLLRQVLLLDARAEIALCGTWVRTLGLDVEHFWQYPTDPPFLRGRMLFDNPLATSSIMMRRSILELQHVHFDEKFQPAEDYELWERISRESEICNVPELLIFYRIHSTQTSKLKQEQQKHRVWMVQSRLLEKLQIEPTEAEKSVHMDVGVGWRFVADKDRVDLTEDWLLKLDRANQRLLVFPKNEFRKVLAERWFFASSALFHARKANCLRYGRSPLSKWDPMRLRRQFDFFIGLFSRGQQS